MPRLARTIELLTDGEYAQSDCVLAAIYTMPVKVTTFVPNLPKYALTGLQGKLEAGGLFGALKLVEAGYEAIGLIRPRIDLEPFYRTGGGVCAPARSGPGYEVLPAL